MSSIWENKRDVHLEVDLHAGGPVGRPQPKFIYRGIGEDESRSIVRLCTRSNSKGMKPNGCKGGKECAQRPKAVENAIAEGGE